MTAAMRCQQFGGRISMGRFLEKCPGCGAQGHHADAVRNRYLQKRSHRKRGHQGAVLAVISFFGLVAVSRMVSCTSKNELSKKVLLPELVVRVGSIDKDIKYFPRCVNLASVWSQADADMCRPCVVYLSSGPPRSLLDCMYAERAITRRA